MLRETSSGFRGHPERSSRPARFPRAVRRPTVGAMPQTIDIETFLEEISRCLRAVDAFREESREPTWLAEEEELQCLPS